VLHLRDRPFFDRLMELAESPVVVHLRMNHVLVDGRQLVSQQGVQGRDEFGIAFHGNLL